MKFIPRFAIFSIYRDFSLVVMYLLFQRGCTRISFTEEGLINVYLDHLKVRKFYTTNIMITNNGCVFNFRLLAMPDKFTK